ncbi:helix-turn-helix domain-containing protein [Planctomycetes bacterium TBK1r]|uniref:Helix-turn-helix domain protein n=1 Tax=Stieleria magnilauensis TaxID=2527963 RepID=A0ABX5XKA0_9BACT|nr:Helix-turn-helix domain protein [Planctomycetes bacterium TBK1r]
MFYTVKEVAKELQISLSMVYALIAKGELICHEFGSCKRVCEQDLLDFLSANRKETPRPPRAKGRHF